MSIPSVFSIEYHIGSSGFRMYLIAFHSFIHRFQIVFTVFATVLHHVHRKVSTAHSHSIGSMHTNDKGIFHNLLYRLPLLKLSKTACFKLQHVFHSQIQRSNTVFKAIFVVSTIQRNHVQIVRGTIQTVFTALFHVFFRNPILSGNSE